MNLLFIDCCISQRGEGSRTAALCRAFLDTWRAQNPQGRVETAALAGLGLKPFDVDMLNRREALFHARRFDDPVYSLARQFAAADRILVGAPFWDLSFPAALRIYIEYISANGVTYHYDDQGPHGDCQAEKLAFLTSGGDFEQPNSSGVEYWRQLCGMYGIPRYDFVFAGGLDAAPENAEAFLAEACAKARRLAEDW